MSSLHEILTKSDLFSLKGLALASGLAFAAAVIYSVYIVIYNLFFHPLKHIPGPLFARASPLLYAFKLRTGAIIPWINALHKQYGEVVRLCPTHVSFISGETAWQDVQGFRTGKSKDNHTFKRESAWAPIGPNGAPSMVGASGEHHSRLRRNVASGFSVTALRLQGHLIVQYADLLVSKLHEVETKGPTNMVDWYNFVVFDIIGDLIFCDAFGCLRDGNGHDWVPFVYNGINNMSRLYTEKTWAIFNWYKMLVNLFKDQNKAVKTRYAFLDKCAGKVTSTIDRIEKGDKRVEASFFASVIRKKDQENGPTRAELDSYATTFLTAGSETTATTLAGATYLLLSNPDKYKKVVHEIRTAFSSTEEINMESVNKLEYTIAALQETFRLYPAISTGMPRLSPPSGGYVSGYYMPPNVSVHIPQYANNITPRNFTDPEEFVPERWMGDPKYKDDKFSVVQPFGFGPTICLGKNLAHVELRVILAKVVYAFDMELDESMKTENWIKKQNQHFLWEKPDLFVKLTPVKR